MDDGESVFLRLSPGGRTKNRCESQGMTHHRSRHSLTHSIRILRYGREVGVPRKLGISPQVFLESGVFYGVSKSRLDCYLVVCRHII